MSKRIYISEELQDVLYNIGRKSMVAAMLYNGHLSEGDCVEEPVNYVSICKNDKTKISYLTSNRIVEIDKDGEGKYWNNSKRVSSRPGVFIKKIFKNLPDKEVEKFSTLYQSIISSPDNTMSIVSGSDILKYYQYDTYKSNSSSLGASCMKHEGCQRFLKIYRDNDVKMVIMLDYEGSLVGRALLWDNVVDEEGVSYKVMDRIYTINDDKYSHNFKAWALDNGYIYKSEQKWFNCKFFDIKTENGVEKVLKNFKIQLTSWKYDYYPYLDTFKFLDTVTGILYNYNPNIETVITISQADGSKQNWDFMVIDVKTNLCYHKHDMIFLTYLPGYVHHRDCEHSSSNDCPIHNTDSYYDEELNDFLFKNDELNNKEGVENRRKYILEKNGKSKSRRKTITNESFSDLNFSLDYINHLRGVITLTDRFSNTGRFSNTEPLEGLNQDHQVDDTRPITPIAVVGYTDSPVSENSAQYGTVPDNSAREQCNDTSTSLQGGVGLDMATPVSNQRDMSRIMQALIDFVNQPLLPEQDQNITDELP